MVVETDYDILLFDLGGVLIDFAGFDELARFMPGSPGRSEVRDLWIQSKSVHLFERGAIGPESFADGVISELQIDLSPREFLSEFVPWVRGPYPGALSLLKRIRSGFLLACLSNSNEIHTPLHRQTISGVIGTCYFSDEMGMVKPDREIFEHVIHDLDVEPGRVAFFDDTPINVDAGRQAGLMAFEVDGLEELETRLRLLGLLNPEPAP